MSPHDLIDIGMTSISAIAVYLAFLRHAPLVPANRIEALEKECARLVRQRDDEREEGKRLAGRVAYLESVETTLRSEVKFWQEEYYRSARRGPRTLPRDEHG